MVRPGVIGADVRERAQRRGRARVAAGALGQRGRPVTRGVVRLVVPAEAGEGEQRDLADRRLVRRLEMMPLTWADRPGSRPV
jgi:hypothetical protein